LSQTQLLSLFLARMGTTLFHFRLKNPPLVLFLLFSQPLHGLFPNVSQTFTCRFPSCCQIVKGRFTIESPFLRRQFLAFLPKSPTSLWLRAPFPPRFGPFFNGFTLRDRSCPTVNQRPELSPQTLFPQFMLSFSGLNFPFPHHLYRAFPSPNILFSLCDYFASFCHLLQSRESHAFSRPYAYPLGVPLFYSVPSPNPPQLRYPPIADLSDTLACITRFFLSLDGPPPHTMLACAVRSCTLNPPLDPNPLR